MNDYFLKTFLPRALQDALTALSGYLLTHGFIAADQTQGFIGASFFILMLIVNRILGDKRKDAAAVAGGLAVASVSQNVPTDNAVVKSIIAGSK